MTPGRFVALLIALVMALGGGWLALAGMGYLGSSSGTSRSWATIGSLLAGLGVALGFVAVQPRR